MKRNFQHLLHGKKNVKFIMMVFLLIGFILPGATLTGSSFGSEFQKGSVVEGGLGTYSVIEYSQEIELSVDFPIPEFREGSQKGTIGLTGEGWMETMGPGDFNLLYQSRKILLPPASVVESIHVEWEAPWTLSSGQSLERVPYYERIGFPSEVSSTLPTGKETNNWRDITTPGVRDGGVQYFRGFSIGLLDLFPITYDVDKMVIDFYPAVEITLKLADAPFGPGVKMLRMDEQGGLLDLDALLQHDVLTSISSFQGILDQYSSTDNGLTRDIPQAGENRTYVIITSSSLHDHFIPLAEWKINKGISAEIVNVSDIYADANYDDVDAQAEIRNFITDAYNTWNTEYVLLGGDVGVVPVRGLYVSMTTGSGPVADHIPSDLYYGCLDGPYNNDDDGRWGEDNDGAGGGDVDMLAEVYVGRASVDTTNQVDAFVNKVLDYERDPRAGYVEEVLFSAAWLDADTDGSLSCEQIESQTFLPQISTTKLYSTLNNASKSNFNSEMNEGVGMVYNVGHANYNGISIDNHTTHYRGDADSLSSANKFSIFYTMGCMANQFDVSDAYSEHMMYNPDGGSVTFIGNSRYGLYSPGFMTSSPSHQFALEYYSETFEHGIREAGKANQLGKEDLSGTVWNEYYRWIYFTINYMGDPSLETWFNEPQEIDVTHPPVMYVASPAPVEVTVKDISGTPIPNARVTLANWPDFLADGYTDASGQVGIVTSATLSGLANITVTGPDLKPYYSTLDITDDIVDPVITVNTASYGIYYDDPGAVVDVDFSNGGGGSDLWFAQYRPGLFGSWIDIFNGSAGTDFTDDWALDWESISNGLQTIYIRCMDLGWNVATATITYEKNYLPPLVELDVDEMGWYRQDLSYSINAHFESRRVGYDLERGFYTINDGPELEVFTASVPEWDGQVPLDWSALINGYNYLNFTAVDELSVYDNSSASVFLKKDEIYPQISVNNDTYGYYTDDPGAVVDVDFWDNVSGLLNVSYRTGSEIWYDVVVDPGANYTDNWHVNFTYLSQGENSIDVRVSDVAGNIVVLEDCITIFIDTMKPEIIANKTVYGWFRESSEAVLDIDFSSGGGSPLVLGEYRIENGDWQTIFTGPVDDYRADWNVNIDSLDEGYNSLALRLVDFVGNVDVSDGELMIGVDLHSPTVSMEKTEYNYTETYALVLGADSFETTFSTVANGSPLIGAQYSVGNSGNWIDIDENLPEGTPVQWKLNASMLRQGFNRVFLRVFDGYSADEDNVSITLLYDSLSPLLNITPTSVGWYNSVPGDMVHIDVFERGSGSNISEVKYKLSGSDNWYVIFEDQLIGEDVGTLSHFSENVVFDFDAIPEGISSVLVRAQDHSGLWEEMEVTIKKDTIPPVAVLLCTPANSADTSTTNIHLTWGAVDKGSGGSDIVHYEYQIAETEVFGSLLFEGSTTNLTLDVQIDASGRYYWRVRAVDRAGNLGIWSQVWSFYKNSPPRALFILPSRLDIYSPAELNATDSTDDDGIIINYSWLIDGNHIYYGEFSSHQFVLNGSHKVRLTVRDDLGKVDVATKYVQVGGSKWGVGDEVIYRNSVYAISALKWSEEEMAWGYTLDDGTDVWESELVPYGGKDDDGPLDAKLWGYPWQYIVLAVAGILIILLLVGIIFLKKKNTRVRKCSGCGKKSTLSSKKCSHCGGILETRTSISNECKDCGYKVYGWENKCPKCGSMLEEIGERSLGKSAETPTKKSRRKGGRSRKSSTRRKRSGPVWDEKKVSFRVDEDEWGEEYDIEFGEGSGGEFGGVQSSQSEDTADEDEWDDGYESLEWDGFDDTSDLGNDESVEIESDVDDEVGEQKWDETEDDFEW